MSTARDTEQVPDGQYSRVELLVMELLAHGYTRGNVSARLQISPSTVARHARVATERAGAKSTVHAIALLVALGRIDVRSIHREDSDESTAVNWLQVKLMSCLDWQEFRDIRAAYAAMVAPGAPGQVVGHG